VSFDDFSHSINRSIYRWIYALVFIIPLNFFIIGEGYVIGIQWAFVRFQVSTDYGPSIIPATHSLSWVLTGILTGRSAVSLIVFFLAVTGLVISFLLLLSPEQIWVKKAGFITLVSGILLIISAILQYGLFFHGSSGILIPVGIPLVLVLGFLLSTTTENKSDGSVKRKMDGIPGPDTPDDQKTSETPALENSVIKNRLFPFVSDKKELIFLFIITILFFSRIFLHPDQIIVPSGKDVGSDIILLGSFWRSFFASSILQGSGLPFWNPYVFSGTPFIGDPLSAMFYPAAWVFLLFNSDLLFGYLFVIDILLIGFFTYFFAREINLNKFGSLISAVTFMFCGAIIPRIFAGHLGILDAIVWFILALLFYERSSKSGKVLPCICAGISFGMMVLAGNIQFVLYGIVVAVMYVILRVLLSDDLPVFRNRVFHLIIILFISFAVCGLVSAVQLLPTWEYSQLSNRAGGVSYDFSTELSLPPSNMITLVVPDYFGSVEGNLPFPRYYYWEFSLYLGILPLVLAMAGLLFHTNRYRFIFGGLALFALVFSLGTYAPLYDVFFHFVPGFSMFRKPSSMLFVFTFMTAILAGFGGEVITTSLTGKEKKRYLLFRNSLLVLAFFSVALLILMIAGWKMPRSSDGIIDCYLIFLAFFCSSVMIIYLKDTIGIEKGWLQRVLITLLVLDLFCFGMHFIDTRPSEQIFKNPAYLPVLRNETDLYFRIYDPSGTLNQNLAYRNNLYLVNGYDPTYLKSYQKFFVRSFDKNNTPDIQSDWWVDSDSISDPDILRLLNVRYIVTEKPEDISGTECVYHDRVFVYRLNSTYPRAYIIAAKEFGNTSPVVLNPAKITGYSPNKITVEAETNEESYLVMSEIWYPGWVARDNNMTVEILKNQDIFRAVRLTPGNHELSFTYFPKIFTVF
jgi:hypothetical protein